MRENRAPTPCPLGRKLIPLWALSVSAVDTTGARDIFGGSAVAQLLHLQKSIEDLTKDDLERIGKFATAAAGLSTLKMGGITSIPSMAEVMEQLSRM